MGLPRCARQTPEERLWTAALSCGTEAGTTGETTARTMLQTAALQFADALKEEARSIAHLAAEAAFQEVVEREGGTRVIAARLGCTPAYVRMLRSGQRAPGREIARRIEAAFGIPADKWDQLPGSAPEAV